MNCDLTSVSHAKYQCIYPLLWCSKYRYEVLRKDEYKKEMEEIILAVAPKVFYCAASTANPSWIDPYGDVYCCQHALGDKSLKVGSIFSKIDVKSKKDWLNYALIKNDCRLKCKQVYFCGGACPMFFRKGYVGQDLCYNFDKILLSRYT